MKSHIIIIKNIPLNKHFLSACADLATTTAYYLCGQLKLKFDQPRHVIQLTFTKTYI